MSLHSKLAGRLSVGGGRGSQRWKGGGSGHDGIGMQNRVGQRSTGVRQALAQRLGVPSTESSGSRLSVGIKARLGNVQRGQGAPVTAGHTWQKEEEYNSPYPATNERRDTVAAERQQQRRNARSIAVTARRGIQESGTQPPSSPVMVKMASGKLVGGMRSDQIQKGPQSPPTNTRVAMDASRGLTVSVPNKRRPPPPSRFGSCSGDASRQEQWSGGRGNMYSEHDDRAGPASSRRGGAGADLHSDWDYSEEDVGLELRSRRRHDSDSMDVDSNAGGDLFNASLQFTRTTTHHHHHHHHGPSPPPQPPLFAVYGGGYRCEGSPPPQKVLYRRASPRRGSRYEHAAPQNYSPNYSPPPPPSPPSFHPRYRYAPPFSSPSPSPPSKNRQQFIEVVKNKTNKSRVAAKAHSYKAALKTARLVKRGKIIKPAKKVKKLKTALKASAIKARQGKLKKKKKKLHSTTHASSPDSVSSDSDQDSSSSSSSGSSSSESSYSERSHQVIYKPPVERVLPEPHKQVLDQQVRACIAALQGKEPDYTSGPGPGVKNLVFVPTMTTKPLHQRFTVDSGR